MPGLRTDNNCEYSQPMIKQQLGIISSVSLIYRMLCFIEIRRLGMLILSGLNSRQEVEERIWLQRGRCLAVPDMVVHFF